MKLLLNRSTSSLLQHHLGVDYDGREQESSHRLSIKYCEHLCQIKDSLSPLKLITRSVYIRGRLKENSKKTVNTKSDMDSLY